MQVLIGLDGWGQASSSMQQLCEEAFPEKAYGAYTAALEERNACEGVALRGDCVCSSGEHAVAFERLDVTLYIKSRNRKKDDTMALFLSGFMRRALPNAEYSIMTDVGTLYDRGCFLRILQHFHQHPRCAGATGRMRVAACCPWDAHRYEGCEASWCHGAQAAEYECDRLSNHDFMSYLGCMTVLHGPLMCLRMRLVEPELMDEWTALMAESKGSAHAITTANLRLGEDRVLTLGVLKHSASHAGQLHWVPDAAFFVQAESTLCSLFAQRRRWNSGCLAARIFLLRRFGEFTQQRSGLFSAGMFVYEIIALFLELPAGALSPAVLFCLALNEVLHAGVLWPSLQPLLLAALEYRWWAAAVYAYVVGHFTLAHHIAGQPRRGCLRAVAILTTLLSVFVFTMQSATTLAVFSGARTFQAPSDMQWCVRLGPLCHGDETAAAVERAYYPLTYAVSIVSVGLQCVMCTQFALLCIKNREWESPAIVARNCVPYVFLWSQYNGWFVLAHLGMSHVLSWGNRPDAGAVVARGMRRKSAALTATVLGLSSAITFGYVGLGVRMMLPFVLGANIACAIPRLFGPSASLCIWTGEAAAGLADVAFRRRVTMNTAGLLKG